ncbi:MAG: winged helix-turn-helix domain-containing protein [Roseburia sp.]|nr:winged helix-turn-helix domain-containing protein [Anaeroplasma bactoclasticum]MCM1197156.1 winged helix-turn-helix domain-containing protein [Roseburia sp.]MCM1556681.1 winged helix-turn-helix domain-containing protein [Anaeroplasma bactoclasticum]
MEQEELNQLRNEMYQSQKILEALSSRIRQDILLELAKVYPTGLRIGEVKMKKCITRPTMSHHLKLLCKAGLIKYYKEGTKNYYYLATTINSLEKIKELFMKLQSFSGDNHVSSN